MKVREHTSHNERLAFWLEYRNALVRLKRLYSKAYLLGYNPKWHGALLP